MNIAMSPLALMLGQDAAPEKGAVNGSGFAEALTEAVAHNRPPPGPEPPPIVLRSEIEAEIEPNAQLEKPDSLRIDETSQRQVHVDARATEDLLLAVAGFPPVALATDHFDSNVGAQKDGKPAHEVSPNRHDLFEPVAQPLKRSDFFGPNRSDVFGVRRSDSFGASRSDWEEGIRSDASGPNRSDLVGGNRSDLFGPNRSDVFGARRSDLIQGNRFDVFGAKQDLPTIRPVVEGPTTRLPAYLNLSYTPNFEIDEDTLAELRVVKVEAEPVSRTKAGGALEGRDSIPDELLNRMVKPNKADPAQPVDKMDQPATRVAQIAKDLPVEAKLAPEPVQNRATETATQQKLGPDSPSIKRPSAPLVDLPPTEVRTVAVKFSAKIEDKLEPTEELEQPQPIGVSRSETRSAVFATKQDNDVLPTERRNLILRQVADQIEFLAAARPRGGVTIQLNPLELGTIMLKINSRGNQVEAQIQASNEQVRIALEHSRPQLSHALESRGLSLGNVTFSGGMGQQQMADHGFRHAQEQAHQSQQNLAYFGREFSLAGAPMDWRSAARQSAGVDLWI